MGNRWQNSALTQIGQAIDSIAGDIQRKREERRLKDWRREEWTRADQIRREGQEREDTKERMRGKLSLLGTMYGEPGITDDSRKGILDKMGALISDPNVDVSGVQLDKRMIDVPEEWDRAFGGFFSGSGRKQLPEDKWMKFQELYQKQVQDAQKKQHDQWMQQQDLAYKNAKLNLDRYIAELRAGGDPSEKTRKAVGAKLQDYLGSARDIAEQGGFPQYDELGNLVGVQPINQKVLQKYIADTDRLHKKLATGAPWTEEDVEIFYDLGVFYEYYHRNTPAQAQGTGAATGNIHGRYGKPTPGLKRDFPGEPETLLDPRDMPKLRPLDELLSGKKRGKGAKPEEEDPFDIKHLLDG